MKKDQIIKLYKKVGETPLECLDRFRFANPKYRNEKMTYAGRLDPLAEGELLVLVGEACKNKEKYLKLDKEYEVDILFGFETDSYDVLGLVSRSKLSNKIIRASPFPEYGAGSDATNNFVTKLLASFVGRFKQPYPPYSSRYFAKARVGKLNNDEILNKTVEIYKIKLLRTRNVSKKYLTTYINKSVNSVKGDFRQKVILKRWKDVLNKTTVKKFPVISVKVRCSSGTYMRSLAHNIGKEVGISSLALAIKRNRIYL